MAIQANERIGDGPAVPNLGGAPSMNNVGVDINSVTPEYTRYTGNAPSVSFADIFNRFKTASRVSTEGAEFIRKLTEELTDPVKSSMGIQVKSLSQPNSTLCISCNGHAILMLFSEACTPQQNMATISLEDTAAKCMADVLPELKLLSVIVVTPNEYKNLDRWVQDIINTFIGATTDAADELTNALLKNAIFTYSDDKVEYENAVRILSPHEIPLRHDGCLTIYYNDPKNNKNAQQDDRYQFFQDADTGKQLFGTVSYYREFVRDGSTNVYKFLPLVHISDINCVIKSPKVIPIFLAIVHKKVILNSQLYSSTLSSIMGGAVNGSQATLGCLIPDSNDPTGRFVIDSREKLDQFYTQALYPEQLVLDVNEGRSKIPGIELFADQTKNAEVVNSINQFLGSNVLNNAEAPCTKMESIYRGTFNVGNMVFDTQFIDFISEYSRRPTEATRLEKLQFKRLDPTQKTADLKEIEPEAQFFYRTDFVILTATFMYNLANQLSTLNVGTFGANGIFNLSSYVQNANAWKQAQQNFVYGPTALGGFNPIGYVYR